MLLGRGLLQRAGIQAQGEADQGPSPLACQVAGVKRGEGSVQIEVGHIGVRLELDPGPGLEERIKRCREGYPELIMVFCGDVPPELFERALDFETTPTPFSETNVAMVNRGLKLRREGKKLVV